MQDETSAGHVRCVAVVGGGPGPEPRPPRPLPAGTIVVAADSGIDVALAAGYRIDVAVGDLDSVSAAGLAAAAAAGATIERHPRDKEATDLELALDRALALEPDRIIVIGTVGGRLDHEVATLLGLAAPRLGGVDVVAHLGPATVGVVRPAQPLVGAGVVGDIVSLLPIHGPVTGVTTFGLRWPLADEPLDPGTSRGCSNEVSGPEVRVACGSGVLLVIWPGTRADRPASSAARSTDHERSPR